MNINAKEFKKMVGGGIFTATFIKKDGTIRKMVCRFGVKKHLKGGASTTAHIDNLMCVFDMEKNAYRCINTDTLLSLKFGEYVWNK